MNDRTKPIISLTTIALFGLAATCDANADTSQVNSRTDKQIEVCIAEIGKHANYANTSKVVHWVADLDQKTLKELQMRVSTTVYPANDSSESLEYETTCVTDVSGKLVRFRIDPVETTS